MGCPIRPSGRRTASEGSISLPWLCAVPVALLLQLTCLKAFLSCQMLSRDSCWCAWQTSDFESADRRPCYQSPQVCFCWSRERFEESQNVKRIRKATGIQMTTDRDAHISMLGNGGEETTFFFPRAALLIHPR